MVTSKYVPIVIADEAPGAWDDVLRCHRVTESQVNPTPDLLFDQYVLANESPESQIRRRNRLGWPRAVDELTIEYAPLVGPAVFRALYRRCVRQRLASLTSGRPHLDV